MLRKHYRRLSLQSLETRKLMAADLSIQGAGDGTFDYYSYQTTSQPKSFVPIVGDWDGDGSDDVGVTGAEGGGLWNETGTTLSARDADAAMQMYGGGIINIRS